MQSYSDIAAWGDSQGMAAYNSILSQMEEDQFIPGYETPTREIYRGIGRDYGYSPLLSQLLDSYVDAHGEMEVSVV